MELDDVNMMPARSRWFLAHWKTLTSRERRRLRRSPNLRAQHQAWVAAAPKRMNAMMKRVYGRASLADMIPRTTALSRLIGTQP
jgi:hypothetical protein